MGKLIKQYKIGSTRRIHNHMRNGYTSVAQNIKGNLGICERRVEFREVGYGGVD